MQLLFPITTEITITLLWIKPAGKSLTGKRISPYSPFNSGSFKVITDNIATMLTMRQFVNNLNIGRTYKKQVLHIQKRINGFINCF